MKKLFLLAIALLLVSTQVWAASGIIVEYAPFTIKEGVTEDQLMAASQKLQENFADKQSGFIKRELLHLEGRKWVDIVHWATKKDAEKALKASETSPICNEYFSIMEPFDPKAPNGGPVHLELIKSYFAKSEE